jgi:hypothetical protein
MKRLQIPATEKHPELVVLVDDDIAERIAVAAWAGRNLTGSWLRDHYRVQLGGRSLARLIMDAPAGTDVDHANGDTLDNQRGNLRVCTRQQNLQNRRGWSSTGFKGVRYRKARPGKTRECYEAWVGVDGRHVYAGRARSPEDAARLYDIAAVEHFGEFARLNFPAPRRTVAGHRGDRHLEILTSGG